MNEMKFFGSQKDRLNLKLKKRKNSNNLSSCKPGDIIFPMASGFRTFSGTPS